MVDGMAVIIDSLRNRLIKDTGMKKGIKSPSSVLVLLGQNNQDELQITLTKRTQDVETHKGQISFPGGFFEPEDEDLRQTALREAQEEIGLESDDVAVLGALEPIQTVFGVWIHPWVAVMKLPYEFQINEREVERILYLPVERLLIEGLQEMTIEISNRTVVSPGILHENEIIWGATAKLLEQLRKKLLE